MKKLSLLTLFLIFFLVPSIGLSQISNKMLGNVGQPIYTLTVTGSGAGSGTITSNLYSINCTSTAGAESGVCSAQILQGTTVILTAIATTGAFNGWTGSGCSGTGTCTIIINGDKTVDASFLSIPTAGMWAWFKVNEGSGTTIIDYSPTAANGSVTTSGGGVPSAQQRNFFWNTNPGFGTQDLNGLNHAKVLRNGPARNFEYISAIVFVKPLAQDCSTCGFGNGFLQVGESGAINFFIAGWRNASAPIPYWTNGLFYSTTLSPTFGTWYCVYIFSQRGTTNTGMYVTSGGAFQPALTGTAAIVGAGNQNLIQTHNTNSLNSLVIGDILVWASLTSEGIISSSQATGVFNSLKSRYGM